jgi:hypothetical protein
MSIIHTIVISVGLIETTSLVFRDVFKPDYPTGQFGPFNMVHQREEMGTFGLPPTIPYLVNTMQGAMMYVNYIRKTVPCPECRH